MIDTSYHDRRLAERLEDPGFRGEFQNAKAREMLRRAGEMGLSYRDFHRAGLRSPGVIVHNLCAAGFLIEYDADGRWRLLAEPKDAA